MALHYLAKMKIMVIKDIEREEIEFISKVWCYDLSKSELCVAICLMH